MRAYLQLVRLPNVFTAMADILLGYLLTHASVGSWPTLILLLGASSLLYMAGMVLNDYFDRDSDARERPGRPIPSGRVPATTAAALGTAMLAGGVTLAWIVAASSGAWRAGLVASALALAVLAYDGGLKRTPLGPVAMGACRMLNVLLGMSATEDSWQPFHAVVACGIGVYVVGVTIFARTEARRSGRWQLALGLAALLGGIGLLACAPNWTTGMEWPEVRAPHNGYLIWSLIALWLGGRCALAVAEPTPRRVQGAVRSCIFALVVLDAATVLAVQPLLWGAAILLLLVPTMFLGRWIYST